MHTAQLRQADLNLVVILAVVAEERNISRAAERLLLSQPAVTRALQRLRVMFRDDLLVRTPSGYEPTPHGQRILQELQVMLPRIDRLLRGGGFNPAEETMTIRIAATDNACAVVCPVLCRHFLIAMGKVRLDFTPVRDTTFEELEHGRIDLALNADDGHIPSYFCCQEIYEEEFVCVAAKESPYSDPVTLPQYLEASHILVSVLGGLPTIPEKRLAAIGHKHSMAIRVPYFTAAIHSIAGTHLIATVPKRLAEAERRNPALRFLAPPAEISGFKYLMVWHPRLSTDATHIWFREMILAAGRLISAGHEIDQ
jgi:DNA-binding transcriptional LysR family regulator